MNAPAVTSAGTERDRSVGLAWRRALDTRVIISADHFRKLSDDLITRVSLVIRPKGSDLVFDHPYNAEYLRDVC
jgi:hypothetical protein